MLVNTQILDKFLKTVRTAKDYNSKEVRMQIADADALADCLAQMLVQERHLSQQIMQLQDKLIRVQETAPVPKDINLNGGGF